MAITVTPKIEVLDNEKDIVRFSATFTDSETGEEITASGGTGPVLTVAAKRAMEANALADYQRQVAAKTSDAAKVKTWLTEAKDNLEGAING